MCTTCGCGDSHQHSELMAVEQDLLAKNNHYAAHNREYFKEHHILALNLVSSPGSGKTTLLTKTLTDFSAHITAAVIEGDQQTEQDAKRIRATGTPAIQINTGKVCHLDAHMVGHGIKDLNPSRDSFLFIENIGNLVCPALFDLGEDHKVVMMSVKEGDDKPLKYPDIFHNAALMIINKMDLLPYVEFSLEKCMAYAKKVNPTMKIIQLSATTGLGMSEWYHWLEEMKQHECSYS